MGNSQSSCVTTTLGLILSIQKKKKKKLARVKHAHDNSVLEDMQCPYIQEGISSIQTNTD